MNTKTQEAVEIFNSGFNCAQSVLAAFAPDMGLSRNDSFRIAGAFGAGMGRMGKVCGAVTGAFMVIGLRFAKTADGEDHLKAAGYRLVGEFSNRFSSLNGSIDCHALLGVDLGTDEGMAKASADGLFKTRCAKYVEDAVRILEEILEESV